jgi:LDH2 family malate/lactate/ureidoglycolate dehydrogenase
LRRFTESRLRAQTTAILKQWGMAEADIALTVPAIVYADISGIDSHGIATLLVYDPLVGDGTLNMTPNITTVTETPAVAVLTADRGLGRPASVRAIDTAVAKAKNIGIGAVAVTDSRHFGAAGYYVRRAARNGLIAIATTTTRTPAVLPTGGAAPVLGTNPLAFAAPTTNGEPLVLDMSTSTVAMNKVKAYALRDEDLPQGWVLDESGRSITDAAAAYRHLVEGVSGGLAPLGGAGTLLGGHKGYGLSLMVQILSAALAGADLPVGPTTHCENVGHFFLAIDPGFFNPDGGAAGYTADLVDIMHSSPPADPRTPVLVPGEPEVLTRRERAQSGIPVPDRLLNGIREICDRREVEFVLTEAAACR